MILFHHRAAGRIKKVEPEVVATSPTRSKNPVPVCCGFDSLNLVLVVRFALTLATLSTSCLCGGRLLRLGLHEQTPPAGLYYRLGSRRAGPFELRALGDVKWSACRVTLPDPALI